MLLKPIIIWLKVSRHINMEVYDKEVVVRKG